MKKSLLLVAVLFILNGCTSLDYDNKEISTKPSDTSASLVTEEKQGSKDDVALSPKDAFIVNTFKEYGVEVRLEDLIIKEEGNHKTAVIYKDYSSSKKPLISKLIFTWKDVNNYEIYHLTIENKVIKN